MFLVMSLIDKTNFVKERQYFIAQYNDIKMNFLLLFSVFKILIILFWAHNSQPQEEWLLLSVLCYSCMAKVSYKHNVFG